jgi:hypothetical protein
VRNWTVLPSGTSWSTTEGLAMSDMPDTSNRYHADEVRTVG